MNIKYYMVTESDISFCFSSSFLPTHILKLRAKNGTKAISAVKGVTKSSKVASTVVQTTRHSVRSVTTRLLQKIAPDAI